MTNDEHMIRVLIEYIEDIGEPNSNWPTHDFEKVSYSRWAAEQILATILAHPEWTPMRSVEEFKNLVGKFASKPTHKTDATFIFRTAYDVATDVSDIFYAMTP